MVDADDDAEADEDLEEYDADSEDEEQDEEETFLDRGRYRPDPDHHVRDHLLLTALLPRRARGVPGPRRKDLGVRVGARAGPLPGRQPRPRAGPGEHVRAVQTAAVDGSLDIEVTDQNVYVLPGLADDLAEARTPSTRPVGVGRRVVHRRRRLREGRRHRCRARRVDPARLVRVVHSRARSRSHDPEPAVQAEAEAWRALENEFETRLRPNRRAGRSADQHRVTRLDHPVDQRQPLVEGDERRLHRVDGEPFEIAPAVAEVSTSASISRLIVVSLISRFRC